jgi:4-hydroxybenzoate polyprenyltransferase
MRMQLLPTRGVAAAAGLALLALTWGTPLVPILGLSRPAHAAECSEDIGNLSKRRMDIIQSLNKLAKSSTKGQLDPALSCPKLRELAVSEKALLDYLAKNKDWCMVPDEAIMNLDKSYKHSIQIADKACAFAAQEKKAQQAPGASLPDAGRPALLRHAPSGWQPYIQLARLDRPIGWWLLLLPCWWSSLLASVVRHAPPNLWHLLLFLIGAVAMRGAGTTYNDFLDRDIDGKVERTRNRPLASGRVSPRAAMLFLIAQILIGLAVLLCFNNFTIALAPFSLVVVAVYPLMKRVTFWPQAVLGFAFAFGALVGWAAEMGRLAWPAILLYAGGICWTIGYDTIYALQDIEDDLIAGVKSTALRFGARVREGVGLFYALAFALIGAALFAASAARGLALLGWLCLGAHFAWQIWRLDPADGNLALRLFRSNRDAGLIFAAGLAGEALLRMPFWH